MCACNKASIQKRFSNEKVIEKRYLNEEMYLRSKIANFILATVLSLQGIPSYAHTQSGKLIDLRYDSAQGLIISTLVR